VDLPALGFAAGAAVMFSAANNLQHGAASGVPIESGGPVRLLLRLLRTPRWLAGSLFATVALALHAVALARGGVILVQSILATGLIVALGVEAVRERRGMPHRELSGALLLVAGVSLLLGIGRPGGGRSISPQIQLVTCALLAVVAVIGLLAARPHRHLRASAAVMGAAAGACFALDAVFLKGVATSIDHLAAMPALTSLAGFAVASVLGNLLVQRAYQRAPLRIALPAVTAADPLAAFGVGRLLLGERLQGGPGAGSAVLAGLLGIAIGIAMTTAAAPGLPRA
jgi:drug/metabolite transporter (DMT)-like permease